PTEIYTLSLHDALPILAMAILALSIWYLSTSLSSEPKRSIRAVHVLNLDGIVSGKAFAAKKNNIPNKAQIASTFPRYFSGYLPTDRKSTRLNSSHVKIS